MAVQSYLFDFSRVDNLFRDWNTDRAFKVIEMDGTSSNFQLVFSSYSYDNINDCLNANGTLSSSVTVATTLNTPLKYDNGVITIASELTWNIGDNYVPLKSVFVRHKNTGYVMGYSININSFDVSNELIIPKDTILWSIQDG